MVLSNEDEFKQKIQDGFIVESREEMTEGYRKALIVQLTVQADTELMSAPAYWMAARHAPSTNTQVSAHAIIQENSLTRISRIVFWKILANRKNNWCTAASHMSSSIPMALISH